MKKKAAYFYIWASLNVVYKCLLNSYLFVSFMLAQMSLFLLFLPCLHRVSKLAAFFQEINTLELLLLCEQWWLNDEGSHLHVNFNMGKIIFFVLASLLLQPLERETSCCWAICLRTVGIWTTLSLVDIWTILIYYSLQ